MNKKTIRDIDLQGKTVLARLDWNVPVKDGQVVDTYRIAATKPTIDYLLAQNCRIIVASHLGRPDGQVNPKYSLAPVAASATTALGHPVAFVAECVGPDVQSAVDALQPGQILLLENVRFHAQEEANDPDFARQLVDDTRAQAFVYDAFASYRPHASTEGASRLLPAVAGLLVEREVDYITNAITRPNRPLVGILGGAKVSTKLEILGNLIPKVDALLLTGPIANTFALAYGRNIGQSIAEADMVPQVKQFIERAKAEDTQLIIPEEVVVSKSLERPEKLRTIQLSAIQPDDYIVDAAPSYADILKTTIYDYLDFDGTSTVIWNGPLGIIEVPEFRSGSRAMAEAIIATKCTSIVGGGDTAGFIDQESLHDKFTWISTGGGASLELMSGKGLPCVEALQDK